MIERLSGNPIKNGLRPRRILIVENERVTSTLEQRMLTELGYEAVGVATSGEDAIRMAGETAFDLVLMDILLGTEMTGVTAAGDIHGLYDTPILFVTAEDDEETLQQLQIPGAFGYVRKPFSKADLCANIEIAMSRHEAEYRVRESEERVRLLLDSAGDGILGLDADGICIFCNPSGVRMLGFEDRDQVVGQTLQAILRPRGAAEDVSPMGMLKLQGVFEDGTPVVADGQYFFRRDGSVFLVEYDAFPIFHRQAVTGCVLIFKDVTGERKARRALVESELKFRAMADSASDAVVMMDSEGNASFWNKAAEHMFGYKIAEVIGKPIHDLIVPTLHSANFHLNFPRFLETGEGSLVGETTIQTARKKDGSEFPVELSVGAVRLHEQWSAIGIIRDITGRAKTERHLRETERLQSLCSLAGGMAHELNNKLLPILTLSEMTLKNLPEESRERERLEKVVEAARQAEGIVAQVMSFSRQESPKQDLVDIRDVISGAMELLRTSLPATITIRQRLDKNVGNLWADPRQIHTVLMNLATNATDAMEGKVGRLDISLVRIEVDEKLAAAVNGVKVGTYARISVADTGSGMDAETAQRVFDPFFTTKEVGEGTGLGLSMVHGIVTRHHGAVEVSSRTGEGTMVHVYLPLHLADESG